MTAEIDSPKQWWVMTHLRMKQFKEWLIAENVKRLGKGEVVVEPFFPADFLTDNTGGSVISYLRNAEDLTSDLSRFVFIKASTEDIDTIVCEEAKLGQRYRLLHYRDTNGHKAMVPQSMMEDFFNACLKYRGYFEIVPPLLGIEAMDRVEIKSGPFAGQQASVTGVRHSKGGVELDLELELVSGVMNIKMSNVDKSQVSILNRSTVDAIRTDFIEYTQLHILEILEHRVKGISDEAVKRGDMIMLTRLYRYRNQQVENAAARVHFLALMLICAHLCRYTPEEKELTEQALACLAEINSRRPDKAATDSRAYLWIALYIATRNPEYRELAKQYIRDFQPKSGRLRHFVALIRTGKKV